MENFIFGVLFGIIVSIVLLGLWEMYAGKETKE